MKRALVFYPWTNHKLVMDPRNNPHVSLFSFSCSPPLSPPSPQNCFLHRVSLTYFPSRSPIRGYLNLLTAGLYPRDRLPIRAHADDSPPTPFSLTRFLFLPVDRRQLYKSVRTCVPSLSIAFSHSSLPLLPCSRSTFLLYPSPATRNISSFFTSPRNNRDT